MLSILVLAVVAAVAPLTPLRVVHRFEAVGRYAAGDRGVDLAGIPGQSVVSATAGTVRFAGTVAGVGVVSVDLGDGRRLTYEPVAPSVPSGAHLAAGAPLGQLLAGRAGCPAPACLHWGLVSGRGPTVSYTDPLALLGRARVRLLPLAGLPTSRRPLPSASPHPRAPSAAGPVSARSADHTASGASTSAAEVSSHASRPPPDADATVLIGSGTVLGASYVRRRRRASRRAGGP
ncbi:MAG TPA: M23 family metallopeptidase [Mycobacteriales bacterium]